VLVIDANGKILDWNPRAEKIFGWKRDEALGQELAETIIPPRYREAHRLGLKHFLATGEGPAMNRLIEMSALRRDGSEFPVELSISPLKTENATTFCGFVTDITERKRAEELLKKQAAELARSNKDLEQFAYVASHDLQEPLRAVAGCLQILQRRYEKQLDANAEELITLAVEGAQRLQMLIEALLAFSRVGTRGAQLKQVECDRAVDAAQKNLAVAIEESGAVITRDPLPTLLGDLTQLTLLFQNLIGNAIKFRRKEQPPRIHIGAETKGDHWTLSVRDNGIGIDQHYFDRIFEIFQRLHTRQEYPGTGIGLAICKKIIERHGGRIWVESSPQQGSTFFFNLPNKAADQLPVESASQSGEK
jgi:PAS domain S-box-containing protein